jgi:hypothetical protein
VGGSSSAHDGRKSLTRDSVVPLQKGQRWHFYRPYVEHVGLLPACLVASGIVAGYWFGTSGLVVGIIGWVLLATLLVLVLFASPIVPRAEAPTKPSSLPWGRLLVVWIAAVLTHGFALLQSHLPLGLDAAFHCTVALNFVQQGRVMPRLNPLEPIDLHYPLGSHFLVAATTEALRGWGLDILVHQVFRWWFLVPTLGASLLFAAWAERWFRDSALTKAAAWMAVFGAYQIGLFPYTWGGLPSQLAMWLAMAGFAARWWLRSWSAVVVPSLLWGAVLLCHHHSALALAIGLATLAVGSALRSWASRYWDRRQLGITAATAGLLALTAAPYGAHCLSHPQTLTRTAAFHYLEPFGWPWEHLWSWGPVFLITTALGMFAALAPPGAARRLPWLEVVSCQSATVTRELRPLLYLALAWLCSFACLDYGARWSCQAFGLSPRTPLTPSRFLFDAQWALLPVALVGLSLFLLRQVYGAWWVGLLCVVSGWVATWERWTTEPVGHMLGRLQQLAFRPPFGTVLGEDFFLNVGRFVDRHAPPEALVVGLPHQVWLTYLTRRESTGLFLPISEPGTERWQLKQELLRDPMARSWEEWSRLFGNVELWAVRLERQPPLPGEKVMARSGVLLVVVLYRR